MAKSITIRDVPDKAAAELAARAALSGRSLQEYIRAKLIELSRRPDAETLLARIRERIRALLVAFRLREGENGGEEEHEQRGPHATHFIR